LPPRPASRTISTSIFPTSTPDKTLQPPVFFFVGKPQHGKTTARKIVEQLTRLEGGSCSDVVYHYLAARRGVSTDSLRTTPKEELRPVLCQAGDFLCGVGNPLPEPTENTVLDSELYRSPSALIRTLYLSGRNCIDGVRRRLELQHAREHLDWTGVQSFVFLIERPGVPEIVDNTEDLREFADATFQNDGTIQDLGEKLQAYLKEHFAAPPEKSSEK
jgi:hypothetical protein